MTTETRQINNLKRVGGDDALEWINPQWRLNPNILDLPLNLIS